jgi:hypothetical protein
LQATVEALGKMWRGEIPLVRAFWLWGVVALALLTFGVQLLFIPIVMAAPSAAMFVMLVLGVGAFAYQIAVSLGVWRSAGRYTGAKVWAMLARGAVILSFASIAISAAGLAQLFTQDSHDVSRSSANVTSTLARTAEYPFTGFWKTECGDNFGLAIEPSGEPNTYSVSFCGPGGCFKPGTYRPNTKISGDSDYRVLGENTIEVKGHDGFSKYVRCQ